MRSDVNLQIVGLGELSAAERADVLVLLLLLLMMILDVMMMTILIRSRSRRRRRWWPHVAGIVITVTTGCIVSKTVSIYGCRRTRRSVEEWNEPKT